MTGTNPIAFAAPVQGRAPLVIDLSLSVAARGKIVAAFRNRDDLSPETLGTYMLGLTTQTEDEMKAGLA